MIKSPEKLQTFEDAERRDRSRALTYYQALDVYLMLWEEARVLNPELGADWRQDVQADIDMARALHARS